MPSGVHSSHVPRLFNTPGTSRSVDALSNDFFKVEYDDIPAGGASLAYVARRQRPTEPRTWSDHLTADRLGSPDVIMQMEYQSEEFRQAVTYGATRKDDSRQDLHSIGAQIPPRHDEQSFTHNGFYYPPQLLFQRVPSRPFGSVLDSEIETVASDQVSSIESANSSRTDIPADFSDKSERHRIIETPLSSLNAGMALSMRMRASDATSSGKTAKASECAELARAILVICPRLVAKYTESAGGGVTQSGSSRATVAAADTGESRMKSKRKYEPARRSGREDSSEGDGDDGDDQPKRRRPSGYKQDAAAGRSRIEWRCVCEAYMGDDNTSCSVRHFIDYHKMLKHIEKDHVGEAHFASAREHIACLKRTQKLSSEEGCEIFSAFLFKMLCPNRDIPYLRFTREASGRREPLPALSGTFLTSMAITLSQSAPVRDLSADLERNPPLKMAADRIRNKVEDAKTRKDAAMQELARQMASKRKEVDDDDFEHEWTYLSPESHKRQRLEDIRREEIDTTKRIQDEYIRCHEQADHDMYQLFNGGCTASEQTSSVATTRNSLSLTMSEAPTEETSATDLSSIGQTPK